MNQSPKQILFAHYECLQANCKKAARRLLGSWCNDAALSAFEDELFLKVIDQLEAEDFRAIRAYRGEGAFEGYLKVLVYRKAIDLHRARYGRSNLAELAKSLGELGQLVYHYHLRAPRPFEDLLELARTRISPAVGEDELTEVIHQFTEAAHHMGREMPAPSRHQVLDENQGFSDIEGDAPTPLDRLESQASGSELKLLLTVLSAKERYIIKLRFEEELMPARIAPLVGLDEKAVSNLIYRSLTKVKAEVLRKGLALSAIIPNSARN